MKPTTFVAAIAVLTATISTLILAGDREHDHGMQVVANNAAPDAPGYGWRYFSDPVARRAVVISPQGDYYYSRGKGLHWIAAEQSAS